MIACILYRIYTKLTDTGLRFANRRTDGQAPVQEFDRVCRHNVTEHRLTKFYHPWTNGQVTPMQPTIMKAPVKLHHYGSRHECRERLERFLDAYSFARAPQDILNRQNCQNRQ